MQVKYNARLNGYIVTYGKALISCDQSRMVAITKALQRIQNRYFKAKLYL